MDIDDEDLRTRTPSPVFPVHQPQSPPPAHAHAHTYRPPNLLQPPAGLGIGLFPNPLSATPVGLLSRPEPYLASPVAAPILSLATHPELSRPLPAVLSAGPCTPGTHYSRSPSVASLANIISHASPPKAKQPAPRNQEDQAGVPNLTNWWSAIASAFGVEGLNDTNTSTTLQSTPIASSSASAEPENSNAESLDAHSLPTRRDASASTTASSSTTIFSSFWSNGSSTQTITKESILSDPESNQQDIVEEPVAIPGHDNGRWRSFKKPRHPLVLCHGLFGFDLIGPQSLPPLRISYWRGVKEALEEQGVEVLVARVPASASIEERARILAQFIEEKLPGREVNLIGHSMGGLDSRFLITHLKPTSFKVASLTTIATPHRGSAFADYVVLDLVGRNNLPKLLTLTQRLGIPGGGKAFEELTMEKMAKFNAQTPNLNSIAYFSYGACFQPGFTDLFRLPWGVIFEREGPNDGMVSVSSATWGEYMGTLENVNHLDLVGWTGRLRYAYAEWTGKKIAFEPVSFFLEVAESLADRGF